MTSTHQKKKSFFNEHPKLFGLGGAIFGIAVIFGLYKLKTSGLPTQIEVVAANIDAAGVPADEGDGED
mgnify:CR=1 FL=1